MTLKRRAQREATDFNRLLFIFFNWFALKCEKKEKKDYFTDQKATKKKDTHAFIYMYRQERKTERIWSKTKKVNAIERKNENQHFV